MTKNKYCRHNQGQSQRTAPTNEKKPSSTKPETAKSESKPSSSETAKSESKNTGSKKPAEEKATDPEQRVAQIKKQLTEVND